jgi:hypothetical protein
VLLTFKLDRLSRNLKDLLIFIDDELEGNHRDFDLGNICDPIIPFDIGAITLYLKIRLHDDRFEVGGRA